jgi:UDP-N-acetylmuramoyl-tripeptide--D-alanyl-D-alanine ligase
MMAELQAPRKRIVLGPISDAAGSDQIYPRVYRAAREVADQVIFIGEHSHRSKASAEDIAGKRFIRFQTVEEAAEYLRQSAIPDEVILLKSAVAAHVERLMIVFFATVRCWKDACGKKSQCVPVGGRGCGLYEVPFEQHEAARRQQVWPLRDKHFG